MRSPHPLQSCDVNAGLTASTRFPAHAGVKMTSPSAGPTISASGERSGRWHHRVAQGLQLPRQSALPLVALPLVALPLVALPFLEIVPS
jgi:hypothetical protein